MVWKPNERQQANLVEIKYMTANKTNHIQKLSKYGEVYHKCLYNIMIAGKTCITFNNNAKQMLVSVLSPVIEQIICGIQFSAPPDFTQGLVMNIEYIKKTVRNKIL